MTNETTKPVVTQADIDATNELENELTIGSGWKMVPYIFARHRLAHSPSEPSVVSQDLVPVAWRYVHPDFGVQVFTGRYDRPSGGIPDDFLGWTETPLYPASAIEAAQIAAIKALVPDLKTLLELIAATELDQDAAIVIQAEVVHTILNSLEGE